MAVILMSPQALKYQLGGLLFCLGVVIAAAAPAMGQTTLPLHPEDSETPTAPATAPEQPESTPGTAAPDESATESAESAPVSTETDPAAPEPGTPASTASSVSDQAADHLIGQPIAQVLPALLDEGWFLVVQTPRFIQMESQRQGLDLEIDADSGEIVGAILLNL